MLTTALSKPRFVFISYAEEDTKHADELINKLNSHSIDTWAAYKNIKPGDIWDASIERLLRRRLLRVSGGVVRNRSATCDDRYRSERRGIGER